MSALYKKYSRTRKCEHLVNKLESLRENNVSDTPVTVDIRNDCMCLGISYNKPNAYVHIDDFILIAKDQDHFKVIDCTHTKQSRSIYDFMADRVSLQDMETAYGPENVFTADFISDKKDEMILRITK